MVATTAPITYLSSLAFHFLQTWLVDSFGFNPSGSIASLKRRERSSPGTFLFCR